MGNRYVPPSFIEQLIERADIVKIIGDRVRLKRSGSGWVGLCPFHQEKGASFTVNAHRQFFHCFGCHTHGSVLSFLMRFDNLTFLEAVEKLAGLLGIAMPAYSEQDLSQQRARARLFEVNKSISGYFQRCLQHNSAALAYLAQRGVSQEICQRYQIGYAPRDWHFIERNLGRNWRLNELCQLGLSTSRRYLVPKFKNRIIFPIRDPQGRVLGFGGRTIIDDPVKYLNSPETELYHKGSCWYGLHEARAHDGELLVVEGYLDVISLAQYGVQEAVASCGTAISTAQLNLLTRRAKTILFCFDGDAAGRQAAWRAVKAALPLVQDATFQLLFLPKNEDPDSLIRKYNSADEFRAWSVTHRVNLEDVLIKTLTSRHNMHSIAGKQAFLQEMADYLALMPHGIFYQLMLKRVSELTQVDPAILAGGKAALRTVMRTNTVMTDEVNARDSARSSAGGNVNQGVRDDLASTKNNASRAAGDYASGRRRQSCHHLIVHLLKLLIHHPVLAGRLSENGDLLKIFAGGAELCALAGWIVSVGIERVNFGQIAEHERDQCLAPYLQKIMCTPLAMAQEELASEFESAIKALRGEQNKIAIQQMIDRMGQQELSADEKLRLQTLIRQDKLQAMTG